MRVLLSLLYISIFTTKILANDCTSYDLRLQNFSMKKVKVISQQGRTCYANTLAQALDAFRLSHNDSDSTLRVNYLQLASSWGLSQKRGLIEEKIYFESGHSFNLFDMLKNEKTKICLVKDGISLFERFSSDISDAFSDDLEFFLEKVYTPYYNFKTKKSLLWIPLVLNNLQETELTQHEISNLKNHVFDKIDKIPERLSTKDFLHVLISNQCTELDENLSNIRLERMNFNDFLELKNSKSIASSFIESNLKNHLIQPIITGYCHKFLHSKKNSFHNIRSYKSFEFNEAISHKCGQHASLIIGQKTINNKCHLIVRDNKHCDSTKENLCDKGDYIYEKNLFLENVFEMGVMTKLENEIKK